MDDKTTMIIEKLSDKLGTTTEHLWNVLLHQAPISGAIDLFSILGLILFSFFLVRFVKRKTTRPDKTPDDKYPSAAWEDDGAILAWGGVTGYIALVVVLVLDSTTRIVAAFFNPEYWALSYILDKM